MRGMIALDTNVLVRYLVDDDAEQAEAARTLLEGLTSERPGFVCREVMVELVWVLQNTIVIEESPRNYAAYVLDLPGCVATGATKEEVVSEIRQAILFHIESLREHGEPVPEPRCTATVVEVAAVVG